MACPGHLGMVRSSDLARLLHPFVELRLTEHADTERVNDQIRLDAPIRQYGSGDSSASAAPDRRMPDRDVPLPSVIGCHSDADSSFGSPQLESVDMLVYRKIAVDFFPSRCAILYHAPRIFILAAASADLLIAHPQLNFLAEHRLDINRVFKHPIFSTTFFV